MRTIGEQPPEIRAASSDSGRSPELLPRWLTALLVLALVAGILAFLLLLSRGAATRAWQIFLVNFLYWPGISIAGAAWAAIFEVTRARWPRGIRRLAEACAAYLPVAFLLFLASWFGRYTLFPWSAQPVPAIASWLNLASLFGREAAGLLLLFGTSLLFVIRSLRRSVPGAASDDSALRRLGVFLLILYAVVYTIFAWDFAMSIQPGWSSTIFAALFFAENLYLGLAAVTVLAVLAGRIRGIDGARAPEIFNNLGKLLLSFSLLWIYLFGSQYLVIWYGNLPREISFVLARTESDIWRTLAFLMLLLLFALPFLLLLSASSRRNPKVLLAAAGAILAGIWLQRLLLVAPALIPALPPAISWAEMLVTGGFLASFVLTYQFALARISSLTTSGGDTSVTAADGR
jgi:Ni/Fe-hydrogenase subunit HybB-like protein